MLKYPEKLWIKNMKMLEFEKNKTGRDLVMGSIAGHFDQFFESLEVQNFDFNRDRIFCLGLTGNKAHSWPSLSLLKEDWFFSVKSLQDVQMEESILAANRPDRFKWQIDHLKLMPTIIRLNTDTDKTIDLISSDLLNKNLLNGFKASKIIVTDSLSHVVTTGDLERHHLPEKANIDLYKKHGLDITNEDFGVFKLLAHTFLRY